MAILQKGFVFLLALFAGSGLASAYGHLPTRASTPSEGGSEPVLTLGHLPKSPSAETGARQETASRTEVVAFLHATVIPMDKERVLRDHTVVVADSRIATIGPTAAVEVPRGALRVDAGGRYLLPALCDMHVHPLGEIWNLLMPSDSQWARADIPFESFYFPYVAKGVTTVQVMSATPDEVANRDRIARGEVLGPRLILARMIDGPERAWPPPLSTWVTTPMEARDAVRQAKSEGYEKMKVYSFLSKESYDAIMSTAKELEMDVIGHIPMSLSVEYVVDAGQKLIAHTEEVSKHAGGNYSAERIDYFADLIASHGVWMTPTLVTTRRLLELFDDPDVQLARPEAMYFRHPLHLGVRSFMVKNLYEPIPPATRKDIREAFEALQRPLTKALHNKHGGLMTGTDTGMPGLNAGFSLHDELQELVDVGLTPFEALRASTTAPFEYLGESDRAGTIEVGRQTDLLLLEENPLEDIAAASKIAGVWMRGRWIAKEEIQERMRAIAASYEVPGGAPPQSQ